MNEFTAQLDRFVEAAQKIMDDNREARFPDIPRDVLSIDPKGIKYAKIVRGREGGPVDSVHCFVNKGNGDVLKAAGWKAPAKHARGNIFDDDHGASAMTPYGAAYLR